MLIANESMYDQKKTLILERYTKTAASEDPKTEEEAIIDLIIELVCFHRDLDPNDPNARESLQTEIRAKMLSFDPNDPQLTHPAKLLRLLGGSTPEEMLTYAEDLVSARLSDERQKQVSRARTPRESDGLNQILYWLVRNNPSISKPEVLAHLRDVEGHGVIIEVDEELIEYYPTRGPDAKTAAVSGLSTRLAKIRKQLR